MLYGSETWCPRKDYTVILRRTESKIRATFGVKLIENKNNQEMIDTMSLKEALDRLSKAYEMRWYGHLLRRDSDEAQKRALDFGAEGRRQGRPKMI